MATGTLAPMARQHFWDANGDPLSLGTLATFLAGTSTPVATYSDVGLTTANPTTITFNSAGRPSVSGTEVAIYLDPGVSYKFIVKNAAGSTIWTQDHIGSVPPATVNLDVAGTAGETLAAGEAVYLSNGSGGLTAGRWYKTDADLLYASAGAGIVGMVVAAIASGESGQIRISGRMTGLAGLTAGSTYYVGATAGEITATAPTFARIVGVADSTTSLVISQNPPGVVDPRGADGRLTLTTAVPVTTSDVTAATTIYYTPHVGAKIALYSGDAWVNHGFSELSLSIAGLAANTPFDVFVYNNAGTLTLETTAWTNDTTRATALVRQDGVWVKTGATTRRYVGTFRTTGTIGQTEDSLAKRYVWNVGHRVDRPMRVLEATNSWTYNSTIRQANASTANQMDLVAGLAEDAVSIVLVAHVANSSVTETHHVSIGMDSVADPATGCLMSLLAPSIVDRGFMIMARLDTIPAVGRHYFPWLESASNGGGTATWYGDNNTPTRLQSGLTGIWRA